MAEDERREPRRQDTEGEQTGQWARLAGVGTEFFVALLLPTLLGYWLDKVTGWRPWLMVVGGGLGFAVGLMLLLRAAKQQFRN